MNNNPLKKGDIIFPYIYKDGDIEPIILSFCSKRNQFYTTVHPPIVNSQNVINTIKYVGWCNPQTLNQRGLKVYLPEIRNKNFRRILPTTNAIEIIGVFTKSAIGKLVEIRVKF